MSGTGYNDIMVLRGVIQTLAAPRAPPTPPPCPPETAPALGLKEEAELMRRRMWEADAKMEAAAVRKQVWVATRRVPPPPAAPRV